MSLLLFLVPLGIAIVDWFAVARKLRRLEYALKPAVMLALLACLGFLGGLHPALVWFEIGLALSLAGDVFLMLPRERFRPGLVAFLMAHIAYIIGLNPSLPPLNAASLVIVLLVALVGTQFYRRLSSGLTSRGLSRLKLPILAYILAISLMVISALFTLLRTGWPLLSSFLFSAGALCFLLSDVWLAWDHFVARLNFGRTPRMIAYHLGQILIALGALTYLL